MERIVIIGSGGAGKSTLARRLGQTLRLPVFHLDALYWKPNWQMSPRDEQIAIMREVMAADRWIIDGNYGGTMEMRIERADTIIYLDFPPVRCLWNVLKRRIIYHKRSRPDMGAGCAEQVDWEFLAWVWNFRKRSRPEILKRLEKFKSGRAIHILNSHAATDRFLERIARPV